MWGARRSRTSSVSCSTSFVCGASSPSDLEDRPQVANRHALADQIAKDADHVSQREQVRNHVVDELRSACARGGRGGAAPPAARGACGSATRRSSPRWVAMMRGVVDDRVTERLGELLVARRDPRGRHSEGGVRPSARRRSEAPAPVGSHGEQAAGLAWPRADLVAEDEDAVAARRELQVVADVDGRHDDRRVSRAAAAGGRPRARGACPRERRRPCETSS